MLARMRNTFVAGLLTIVPVVVTVAATVWIFRLLTDFIPKFLTRLPNQQIQQLLHDRFTQFGIRVLSLLLLFAGIYAVGLIARNVFGRRLIHLFERVMSRLPLLGSVYSTVHQIGHAFLKGSTDGMFRRVVLIEYPKEGSFALGFVTADASFNCNQATGRDLVSVFVPTTPNPTSGFLLLIPKEKVTLLDMTVAEGMRLVISGGVVRPPDRRAAPNLQESSVL